MILYLTYNDQPSGVYWSQVTDVVAHLNSLGGARVRLVALVSLRNYRATRRAIRDHMADAIVLPMVPRARNWRINSLWVAWLCRRLKPHGIIGRGVFATALALRMRQQGLTGRVCYDGRGAYAAEWEEYRVVNDDRLIAQFRPLEAAAVNDTDIRLAVSEALVAHWKDRYDYDADEHVVVPCTLGKGSSRSGGPLEVPIRTSLGWGAADMVLVYSGSTVGWQSLALLEEVLVSWLGRSSANKLLFLSRSDLHASVLQQRFPDQVAQRWLDHAQVKSALADCDMGVLIREDTVTNRVASPTKFAEYLSAGLPVLISERLGDFSELVRTERIGQIQRRDHPLVEVIHPDAGERDRLRAFADRHFSKHAYNAQYQQLIRCLER
ncbi:MAG: hypothetical protein R2815_00530 [Flavobacteriales bacterium]|nr:hypothetical protein [Flavobacteriales bacterium]